MAITLNDNINALTAKKLDAGWGPYPDVATACASIAAAYRYLGRKVGILVNNVVTEYWWQNDLTDGSLVPIKTGGGAFADLTGTPTDNTALATALADKASVSAGSVQFAGDITAKGLSVLQDTIGVGLPGVGNAYSVLASDNFTLYFNSGSGLYYVMVKANPNGYNTLTLPSTNGTLATLNDVSAASGALATHEADHTNPHAVTLEQARIQNNQLGGDIDANGHAVKNLPAPVSGGDAVNKTYSDGNLVAAKSYTDSKVASPFNVAGGWDASTGNFPTVGTSSDSSVRQGDMYNITVAGTIGGVAYDVGDNIYALINAPGQTAASWAALEHNTQQATETLRGTVTIADATTVNNTASTEDTKVVTTKKLWANFWQTVLNTSWTWVVKQIYSVAPRFNSVTANQYLKVDANNDLTSIAQIPGSDVSAATNAAVGTVALSTNAQGIAGTDVATAMTPASTNAAIVDNGKNFNRTLLVYNLTEIYWAPTQAGTLSGLSGSTDVSNIQYKLGASGTYATLAGNVAFAANQQIWLRWTYSNQAVTTGNIYLTGKYN